MDTTTIFGIAAVPAIMGLVEAATAAGLPKNLAPITAILLGAACGILDHSAGGLSWEQAIAGGIALGLAASGLYSGGKQIGTSVKLSYRRAHLRNQIRRTTRPADGRTDDPSTPQKVT